MNRVIVCNLASGLSDIPRNKLGDYMTILGVLINTAQVSVFDCTYSKTLAKCLDNVRDFGWVEYGRTHMQYPWVSVHVTNAGLQAYESMKSRKNGGIAQR